MSITNNIVDTSSIKNSVNEIVTTTVNKVTNPPVSVVGDTYNFGDNNGTIIIGSNVQGDVTNVTTVDNSVVITKEGDTYTYNGGDRIITNYQQGEKIALGSDFQGTEIRDNSFVVKSSTGDLEIENARDKFIDYTDTNGNKLATSYVASSEGIVDGSDKDEYQVMIGAENADNEIIAGNAGSSLWGGEGGNDTLSGGAGMDEFVYSIGNGNDVVQNASNDIINLLGVSLEQIIGVTINVGEVNANFVDGGSLKIKGDSSVGYKLGDEIYPNKARIPGESPPCFCFESILQ